MKILLISGHGNGDSGACGCGHRECDLTREVVKNVADKLKNFVGVDIFDPSKDCYQFLKKGGKVNFNNYDYMLEIHFNATAKSETADGKTIGTEIFVHDTEKASNVETNIVNNISALGFKNRGVKKTNAFLVMNTCKKKYGVSCALLEVCFITDKDDMNLYEHSRNEIAEAICKGILDGFGIKNESEDDIMLQDLIKKYGEAKVKKAIEDMIVQQENADWKVNGSDYLHKACEFSSTHDQSEPITFGLLGTIIQKLKK